MLKKEKIKVISVGYNNKSDIKIIKERNTLTYKQITIKSFKTVYKLKIKNQLTKNIIFAIATLEILNLDIGKIKNKIKDIQTLKGRSKVYK